MNARVAMMADVAIRIGPNFSCTMVTSGPGATNLLTGIARSYFDSIPSLHICGQVNTYEQQTSNKSTLNVRQVSFQEGRYSKYFLNQSQNFHIN